MQDNNIVSLASMVKPTTGASASRSNALAGPRANENKRLAYCHALAIDSAASPTEARKAWKLLQKDMALVPAGRIALVCESTEVADAESFSFAAGNLQVVKSKSFYIDRLTVTNGDYLQFVKAGGYADLSLWPNQIWPLMVQFVDQTGTAGPSFWKQGKPPRERLEHPVTGISWYEATAYASWVGKQLPAPIQWQRAGTWHLTVDGKADSARYPWGSVFEERRANLWHGDRRATVPANQFADGATPNGIYQLVGNVWEWTDSRFALPEALPEANGEMYEVRGGAFDTYFPSQATCQFRSGQPSLVRASNTGFRCSVPADAIQQHA